MNHFFPLILASFCKHKFEPNSKACSSHVEQLTWLEKITSSSSFGGGLRDPFCSPEAVLVLVSTKNRDLAKPNFLSMGSVIILNS